MNGETAARALNTAVIFGTGMRMVSMPCFAMPMCAMPGEDFRG